MSLEMASSLSSLEFFDLSPTAQSSSSAAERYIDAAFSQLLAMAAEYEMSTGATPGEQANPTVDQSWPLFDSSSTSYTTAASSPPADLALPPAMFLVTPNEGEARRAAPPCKIHQHAPAPASYTHDSRGSYRVAPRATAQPSRATATPARRSRQPAPMLHQKPRVPAKANHNSEKAALSQVLYTRRYLETLLSMGIPADTVPPSMLHTIVSPEAHAYAQEFAYFVCRAELLKRPVPAHARARDPRMLVPDEHEWIPMRGRARPGTAKRSHPQQTDLNASKKRRIA
ncbi:hypothetical protein FA95DRAFT_1572412 [Auriscalpium vulgare]|uniref:Uncharacterized protein n=1 Tax=Auriscalpium vulgare TaxID=40419 RepID=A0ACB8RVI2_9AGAM|nr:hypothetical protein FA95DRAFT_1572412 [Auriscalpium vulgare]